MKSFLFFSRKISVLAAVCFFYSAVFLPRAYAMTDALKIKIAGGVYSDETIIRFVAGASSGFDGNFDAWKLLSSTPAVPNIFTKDSSGGLLTINALPPFTASRAEKLFLRINVASTYSFTPLEMGAFGAGVSITMIDMVTGRIYDLRASNTFTVDLPVISQSDPARFLVLFSYPDAVPPLTDTLHVVIQDTAHITVADTTYILVSDTVFVFITDTVHIVVQDTNFVSVTDTLLIHMQLTGVAQPNDKNVIKVFPSPTTGTVQINTGNYNYLGGYILKIANTAGQLIFQTGISEPQYSVDLSAWGGSGTYFIQIIDPSAKNTDTRKIILQ